MSDCLYTGTTIIQKIPWEGEEVTPMKEHMEGKEMTPLNTCAAPAHQV